MPAVRVLAVLLLTVLAAACDPAAAPTGPSTVESDAALPEAGCDAARAQWAIGEPASEELLERLRFDAGADLARYLRPGQPVTLEYHHARLNAELDEEGVVVALRCG
ncbi:MAG: I78 family peptidase inhibitor [Hyphomonas sp.]